MDPRRFGPYNMAPRERRCPAHEVPVSMTGERVTYATLAAGQTGDFRRKFDDALSRLVSRLGEDHPLTAEGL